MQPVEYELRELLRQIVRWLGILEKADVSTKEITIAQCHAIVEIGRSDNLSLNELANILLVEKSTMSRTIQKLVQAGLVTRDLDPNNRRSVVIRLSSAGQKTYKQIEVDMENYYHTLFKKIPDGKIMQVLDGLQILLEAMQKEDAKEEL